MPNNRPDQNTIIAGILFILATSATVVSQVLYAPIFEGDDILLEISKNPIRFKTGIIFELINAFASVGIAISLYEKIKRVNENISIGYLSLRTIEGTLGIVAVVCYIVLLKFSPGFQGYYDVSTVQGQTSLTILQSGHDSMFLLVLITFNIGAFFLYPFLYKTGLVPRGISLWGIAGTVTLAVANTIQIYDIKKLHSLVTWLSSPIALNEIVLAIYLLTRGLKSPVQESFSN